MSLRPTPGHEKEIRRPREGGDPFSVQWIPAFAGMTRFSGEPQTMRNDSLNQVFTLTLEAGASP